MRVEWVANTLHTSSEHGVSSISTADAHTLAASSRLNLTPPPPCQFKWTRPFRRKAKSGFCACAITFQTQSTEIALRVLCETKNSYKIVGYSCTNSYSFMWYHTLSMRPRIVTRQTSVRKSSSDHTLCSISGVTELAVAVMRSCSSSPVAGSGGT